MSERDVLRRQVCFALYSASRAATAAYRPLLDSLGLTYPQYLVLLVLWERDGATVRDLGEELELDSGTLSPLLKRMEAAGLLSRQRSSTDERRVEVRLTSTGAALQKQADAVPRQLADAAGLTEPELNELRATLIRLTAALRSSPAG
ncbi:MAG: transcriptional regulator, MarR family [Micrococcaceae bacterium]|jgi:DNA-binding MarR family transcriptional regulator|nr:transcriptional regulator, MarR family [Micrococcaceae bacterium]